MSLQISMPLFNGSPVLSFEAIEDFFHDHYQTSGKLKDESYDKDILSFEVNNTSIILAPMGAAIPWSELEGPCATSILWKDVEKDVKKHTNHMVVTVMSDDLSPIEISNVLTQATAAILSTCPNALGVYWGNATLLIPKNIFCDFATKILPENPPVHIWVDFRVGPDEEGISSGFTTGLAALELMEIEAIKVPEPYSELRERLTSLADYLLNNGMVIKDGDTVGGDQDEKIKVRYADSEYGHKENVIRLNYENATVKKSKWKFW